MADDEFDKLKKAEGFKQCPNCKRQVQKTEGCNHMTCICKYQWCYACEGPYPVCNCIPGKMR